MNIQLYLGQHPGGLVDDGAEAADLLVAEVAGGRELERLEGEALRRLPERGVHVPVGDAAAGGERQRAARGQVLRTRQARGLSQSLKYFLVKY